MAAAMGPTIMLIASNVLGRHPKMNFVLVESGVGWLAWVLQCLDELHEKRHMWAVPHLELPPSDYFKRQGYATFGDDLAGLADTGDHGVGLPDVGQRLPPRRRDVPPLPGSDRADIQGHTGRREDEDSGRQRGEALWVLVVLSNRI